MLHSVNLPLYSATLAEYGGMENLRQELRTLGLDGVEGIWSGEDIPADFPRDLLTGYHLTFFPDWLDFYRGDTAALERKFGSLEAAWQLYGGGTGEALLDLYRTDLDRARSLGAKYVVFHVSDVSMEECYTYRWLHTDEEVIDASAEVINRLLDGAAPEFEFLVENQWWAGFTFTDPAMTKRLLDAIAYPRKGIMLDTGHLMNTNPRIRTQADGIRWISDTLDRHGALSAMIRGLHLHQSLSGAYVRSHTGSLPEFSGDGPERFGAGYAHIQQIDRHRPWTNPEIADVLKRIGPAYVTHELAANDRRQRFRAVHRQMTTLEKGGLFD